MSRRAPGTRKIVTNCSYEIIINRGDTITRGSNAVRYTLVAQITGYALGADGYVGM